VETGGPNWFERILFGRVSLQHRVSFCRQAASYLDAGVDLFKALDSLQKQFDRTALGPVLTRVQQSIRRGDTLAEAMAREPQAFDPQFLSMIRVAETRGSMPETLKRMSAHYEARLRLARQARSAMIYPAAVIMVAIVVVYLLTTFVLPKLVDILADMVKGGRSSLPGPTRVLMAFSGFMRTFGWWLLPVTLVGGIFLLVRWYRTAAGKAMIDAIALRLPVLGSLLTKLETARFARTMSGLLEAGVEIGQSIDLTSEVVRTAPFRRAVGSLRAAVRDGEDLGAAIVQTRQFPSEAVAVVETGETTGKLPETLAKLADQYEEQVEYMVKNMGQLIQPILIIVMGGFAFFIALAFILAYVQLLSGLTSGF
jgi:type II secretory pathway component PulF